MFEMLLWDFIWHRYWMFYERLRLGCQGRQSLGSGGAYKTRILQAIESGMVLICREFWADYSGPFNYSIQQLVNVIMFFFRLNFFFVLGISKFHLNSGYESIITGDRYPAIKTSKSRLGTCFRKTSLRVHAGTFYVTRSLDRLVTIGSVFGIEN